MKNTRQRATSFPDPFEIELDPEKKLWVPNNRSRVFISTAVVAEPKISVADWPIIEWKPNPAQEAFLREQENERLWFLAAICDCSPERSRFLGMEREIRVPVVERPGRYYENVERAPEPQFRSRRAYSWERW